MIFLRCPLRKIVKPRQNRHGKMQPLDPKKLKKYMKISHTACIRNNMGQKCEGNCGLWVLNEIIKKIYPENLKKILGAVKELPAK